MGAARRNRGSVIAFLAVALAASMGLAVVAVDLAHLSTAAGEVQTLADAGATGAVRTLMRPDVGDDEVAAVVDVLLAENTIDGVPGTSGAQRVVQVGGFDFETRAFTTAGTTRNAVRVSVTATVNNLVAGFYGVPQSDVTREAIAAFSGPRTGRPMLPLVIGRCHFEDYERTGACADLPELTQVPDGTDGSGWTSLALDPASASAALRYLPADCGGGGEEPPTVRVGDEINVMNGQANSVLKTVGDCVAAGHDEFVVPIVELDCDGKFNRQKAVIGFATLDVTGVRTKGGDKGLDVSAVCSTGEPGLVPGGPDLGTRAAALVR
jgi:hypothetical protein